MPGPYLIRDVSLLLTLPGQTAVIPPQDAAYGVQCVGLVKVYAGCPRTEEWKKGPFVKDMPKLQRGVAIATFFGGIYPSHKHGNHACFFVDFLPDDTGFTVLEQHVQPSPNIIRTRNIRFDMDPKTTEAASNGDLFSVVM